MRLIPTICHKLLVVYWWLLRPITIGVIGFVLDPENRLLLVKHTYKPGWHLPGGKLGRGETMNECLQRELREEVGIKCEVAQSDLIGVFRNFKDFKSDHVALFNVRLSHQPEFKLCSFEIEEAKFVSLGDLGQLPLDTSEATIRRIQEHQGLRQREFLW